MIVYGDKVECINSVYSSNGRVVDKTERHCLRRLVRMGEIIIRHWDSAQFSVVLSTSKLIIVIVSDIRIGTIFNMTDISPNWLGTPHNSHNGLFLFHFPPQWISLPCKFLSWTEIPKQSDSSLPCNCTVIHYNHVHYTPISNSLLLTASFFPKWSAYIVIQFCCM